MLTYAMEVSNIEGSFRTTCEQVMRVLRDNKESVMAVLEAVSFCSLFFLAAPFPEDDNSCSDNRASSFTIPFSPGVSRMLRAQPAPISNKAQEAPRPRGARRPSILDGPIAPPEFINAQGAGGPDVIAGAPPAARGRARTNSSAAQMAHMANGINGEADATEVQNARGH